MIAKILYRVSQIVTNSCVFLWSRFNLFWLRAKGIPIPVSTKLYGRLYFYLENQDSIRIGRNCRFNSRRFRNRIGINHPCMISINRPNAELKIGDNCGFSGVSIGCFKKIHIGDNLLCGANVLITDSDWHFGDYRSGEDKEVIIGNNVWLGYGVIVLKGVTIGDNSVIGAGSVVTSAIPENSIAAGNPCRVIKSL